MAITSKTRQSKSFVSLQVHINMKEPYKRCTGDKRISVIVLIYMDIFSNKSTSSALSSMLRSIINYN